MRKIVILVTRPGLGTTAPEDTAFGAQMLDTFLHTWESRPEKPAAICFYTEGVRAVAEGSPLLMALGLLEGMGVRLVSCRTCLERYGLADRVKVGETGTMTDIVRLLAEADQVITV